MTTNANKTTVPEHGETVFIPLNKLKKHPKNARKTPHSEASIEGKAASIAAKGMLQNLVVEPETNADGEPTGFYLVSVGEGRRLAQLLRAKRKEIKKTEPVRCVIEDGIYRPSRHLEQAKFDGRVPGGDYEGFVDAHVRRLEALRRAGIAERIDADQWRIPEDFESRAAAYDAGRNRQASIRVLSAFDLESQIGSNGSTWLDRRLVMPDASDLAPAGFGQQVRDTMDQRREHHIEQGDAIRQQDGRIFYRRNLLATLREREVARVGAEMAESKGVPFRAAMDGESVSGTFTGTVQLSSGKFAIVEQSHEFTLVPWRPVIDRQLGRAVAGIVQGGSVSWQMGRQRGLGL